MPPTLLILQHDTYHPLLQFIPKDLPPMLDLKPCCAVCGPKKQQCAVLSTCSRCKCVSYCGRDHQKEDFASHKDVCRYVQKHRKKMDILAAELPSEIFTEHAGHFWHILETRPFMNAKRDYMLALTATRTFEGVSLALAEGLECLRLCRTDNQGIRDAMPALMLMLKKRQQCYDFIKWWATFDRTGTADLNDRSIPMFTTKNAKMSEEIPKGFFSPRTSVFHWAALAFIKIEVAFEVVTALDMKVEVDQELPGMINTMMSFLTKNPLPDAANLEKQCKRMKHDAADAIFMANELNKHFWPSVLNPHSLSGEVSPGFYVHGDRFEVQNWLVPHSLLWSQDPIAKDFIGMFLGNFNAA